MVSLPSGSSAARDELLEINPPASFLSGPLRVVQSVREHRHMVASFIRRDLRLKYRDTTLGFFWSLLEPLLLSGVYFVLFSIISGRQDKAYSLWIVLGVVTWGLFASSLSGALGSLTKNDGMIKQVYFPRELFAITTAGSQLTMAGLSMVVAVPFMIWLGIAPTPYLVMVPLGLVLTALFGLGVGYALACLNVVNRDVEHLMQFVIRAGMFLSPVMWTVHMLPKSRAAAFDLLLLNPLVVTISMVRDGVGGRPLGLGAGHVAYAVAVCIGTFLLGAMIFKKFEATSVKKI